MHSRWIGCKGEIQFEDVSFHYSENKENVLSHVNLDVKPGEYVALVGSSGAGKTTLCSLIPAILRCNRRSCFAGWHRY